MMNFDTENPFDPLINYVTKEEYDFDETMGRYMYMYDEDDVFHYKDKITRKYIHIDKGGNRIG